LSLIIEYLVRYIVPAVIEWAGPIFRRESHHNQVITGSGSVEKYNCCPDGCGLAY